MKKARKTNYSAIRWILAVALCAAAAFAVSSAHAQTIGSTMGPGDSGADVSALQTFLASDSAVYPEGLVTGYYGSLTTAAVERYQCKYGIVCQGDPASTGYGRVGPSTLAKIRMQEGILPGGGVTVSYINASGVGADLSAPVLSVPAVATTATSAVIHWTTNEPAHSRVMFGAFWPFLYASAPSGTDPTFDASSDVVLTGLAPNTTYYYVLESVDASGNLQWGINHSFRTGQ